MATLLTRTITLALSEEDYAAVERRTVGCTPTETARELLRKALYADPTEVELLAQLLFIRRVLLNGTAQAKAIEQNTHRDAKLILDGKPLPYGGEE